MAATDTARSDAAVPTAAAVGTSASASQRWGLYSLVLAQFLCSFAGTSTNVAISPIATDLGASVQVIQAAITLFTLTMAALMIPGSKLTDIIGRTLCFRIGLVVYGAGALIAAASPGAWAFVLGYSFGQGIGTSLLIPPVYILATVLVTGTVGRAKVFGAISAAAGIGSAAGPLIGGTITSLTSWRVTFLVQALVVVAILLLARRLLEPAISRSAPRFDLMGAVLSAAGLVLIVVGILLTGTYGWGLTVAVGPVRDLPALARGAISPVWPLVAFGFVVLALFFRHIRVVERGGGSPLLASRMFRSRTADLGLITQNVQWLILQGMAFVVSVFLQTVRGLSPIETGLVLTPATIGILVASLGAPRLARRRSQAVLVRGGFVATIAGIVLLIALGRGDAEFLAFVPGLLLIGLGVGVMLTSSVNIVQSSFPAEDQGEISGLSRAASNLGSSLGVAIAGSIVVSSAFTGTEGYGYALIVLAGAGVIGLIAALLLPAVAPPEAATSAPANPPAKAPAQPSGTAA